MAGMINGHHGRSVPGREHMGMRFGHPIGSLLALVILWLLWLSLDIYQFTDIHVWPTWQEWQIRGVFTAVWFWGLWFGRQLWKADLNHRPWAERYPIEWVVVGAVCVLFVGSDLIAGHTVNVPLWSSRVPCAAMPLVVAIITRRGLRVRDDIERLKRKKLNEKIAQFEREFLNDAEDD